MSLDYNLEEKLQINKFREIISNSQVCLKICSNEIEVLKHQLKRAQREYNKHTNIININKKQVLKYASEVFFKTCPNDISDIIITQITSDKQFHFYNPPVDLPSGLLYLYSLWSGQVVTSLFPLHS